jgi:hypothetical protein
MIVTVVVASSFSGMKIFSDKYCTCAVAKTARQKKRELQNNFENISRCFINTSKRKSFKINVVRHVIVLNDLKNNKW